MGGNKSEETHLDIEETARTSKIMNDKPDSLPVTDPYRTPTTFVNQVVGSGHLNGVVNITFATAQFTPNADGKVDPDLVISARLRMDLFCAQQLYEQLGKIIEQTLKQTNATSH